MTTRYEQLNYLLTSDEPKAKKQRAAMPVDAWADALTEYRDVEIELRATRNKKAVKAKKDLAAVNKKRAELVDEQNRIDAELVKLDERLNDAMLDGDDMLAITDQIAAAGIRKAAFQKAILAIDNQENQAMATLTAAESDNAAAMARERMTSTVEILYNLVDLVEEVRAVDDQMNNMHSAALMACAMCPGDVSSVIKSDRSTNIRAMSATVGDFLQKYDYLIRDNEAFYYGRRE